MHPDVGDHVTLRHTVGGQNTVWKIKRVSTEPRYYTVLCVDDPDRASYSLQVEPAEIQNILPNLPSFVRSQEVVTNTGTTGWIAATRWNPLTQQYEYAIEEPNGLKTTPFPEDCIAVACKPIL